MFCNSFDEETRDSLKKCEAAAIRYLSYKSRTEKEVYDKLASFGEFEPDDISDVISRLKEMRYIDDKKYAELFVMLKSESKLDGPYKIRQALLKKGIDAKTADKAICDFSRQREVESIKKLISKKLGNAEDADEASKRRIFSYLYRKGFSTQAIIDGFKAAGSNIDADGLE